MKKISHAKYNRLCDVDADESLPEFAGKKIRIAVVAVLTEQRRPIHVLRMDCIYVNVDDQGRFNPQEPCGDSGNGSQRPLSMLGHC